MKVDELIKAATLHAESVKVSRTGINPLLWLVGLITPLALVLSAWTGDSLFRIVLLIIGSLPPLVAIVAWFVLLFVRPHMLESEEYRLRQSAMRVLIDHAGDEKVVNAATEIARIERLLGKAGDGEGK